MVTGVAFLLVVGVGVRMSVIMIVVVLAGSMRVAMAAEDKETDKVGEQAGRTNNEHELGVIDLGGFDESGQCFEDDGNTEGDKENGVEKGTKNLCANPLEDS